MRWHSYSVQVVGWGSDGDEGDYDSRAEAEARARQLVEDGYGGPLGVCVTSCWLIPLPFGWTLERVKRVGRFKP